jgi:mRNA interferase MazF
MTNSKRGEIWLVNLDPTIGAEIQKTRPTVVVSSDLIGKLPLKLVVPITDWKDYFAVNLWHVSIEPTDINGLSKKSAADVLQLRSVDERRFVRKLGILSAVDLQEIVIAIAAVVEYQELSDES